MKYMGGKYFISKQISEVMKQHVDSDDVSGYLEPFCGALSVLEKMTDTYECIASDYHPDLIQMWKDVQNNTFKPPEFVDETLYHKSKEYKSPNSTKGFIGFGMSFGGKFYAGYADKYRNDKKENYLQEAINSINKKYPKIQNVDFQCKSYDEWKPKNMLIYCDPPYQTTRYPIKYRTDTKHYDIFDNEKFWNVMRHWSKNNHVFISETTAPDDFVPIWEKKSHRSASQSAKTRYKNESDTFTIEKLYIHKNNLSKYKF